MADPGNSADAGETAAGGEFSPAELDRLEDALDAWTGAGLDEPVPEDSSLTPALRARLADYRGLLTLARDAMPMQDVSDDLLAGVLAEARAAAPVPGARRREAAGPSLWERLRRSMLLPGVALAGSAALLLWMVQPGDDAPTIAQNDFKASEATAPARLAPSPTPSPAASTPAAAMPAEAASVDKAAIDGAAGGASLDAAPGAAAAPPADAKPAADLKEMDEAKADRGKPRASKKAEEAPEPEAPLPGLDDAPPADSDKEALRDTLDEADALRRSNQCDRAMALYKQAFDMSGPANERAQARAGYGLCLQAQGEDGDAQKYFEFASKMSSSIDSWIKRERGEGSYSKKSARPSKAAPKKPTVEPMK